MKALHAKTSFLNICVECCEDSSNTSNMAISLVAFLHVARSKPTMAFHSAGATQHANIEETNQKHHLQMLHAKTSLLRNYLC
jgi:hypothetical protein